jgi:hypothetical protein
MLVFWKEKLVFLAVPKTGTTAVEGALAPKAAMVLRDPPAMKHAPVSRYKRILQPFYEFAGLQDMESVAVVRDPVDWLGSWYRYRHRDEITGHPNSTKGQSFDDFVRDYMQGRTKGPAAVGSQAKFLLQADGQIGVEHLFRYDAQPKLIRFFETRLNVKITLNRLNVSPHADMTLSPDVAAELRVKCAPEFAVWEAGIA